MNAVQRHSDAVDVYNYFVHIATSTYPARLTSDQYDAYRLIPTLLDECKRVYDLIPSDDPCRPVHYLMCTRDAL